jgi:hypothetical protein
VLSYAKEAEEARIDLKDDDPESVGYLLDYMYGGDYAATDNSSHWLQVAWHSTERPILVLKSIKYSWDRWLSEMTRRSPSEEPWHDLKSWELVQLSISEQKNPVC